MQYDLSRYVIAHQQDYQRALVEIPKVPSQKRLFIVRMGLWQTVDLTCFRRKSSVKGGTPMKNLIPSKDNSIQPNGAIGIQKCGIVFWQKTEAWHQGNQSVFQSAVDFIAAVFAPTSVQRNGNACFLQFENDEKKTIFLMRKNRNVKMLNRFFLCGESHTAYADAKFHLFVLHVLDCTAEKLGCKFCVDDATGYLEHHSMERLEEYIRHLDRKPAVSDDLLRKAILEQQEHP